MVFSEVVGTLNFLQPQNDDDFSDRMSYYFTSTFLLIISVLISLKMFGGRPLECFMPAEFRSSWEDYTEIYCWSSSTYWVESTNSDFPASQEARHSRRISYYQWTPFFMVASAFLFYSPCLLWRILYGRSGIRLKDLMTFANDKSNLQPAKREANIKGMAAHLGSIFKHRYSFGKDHQFHKHRFLRVLNLRFYESYLCFLYILIKCLYLINVLIQMYLMNWFLQTDHYTFYGFGVLWDLFRLVGKFGRNVGLSLKLDNNPYLQWERMDRKWELSTGNIQKHTVQCVLVINIFIEKIFVILWIWYTVLAIVTVGSLINWSLSSLPFEARKRFIVRRLELADVEFRQEEFVTEYVKMDGVFVLKMLTIHSGILVCTELVDCMWEDFRGDHEMDKASVTFQPSGPPMGGGPLSRRKTSVLVPLVARQEREPSFYPGATSPLIPGTPSYFGSAPMEPILRMPTGGGGTSGHHK